MTSSNPELEKLISQMELVRSGMYRVISGTLKKYPVDPVAYIRVFGELADQLEEMRLVLDGAKSGPVES